MNDTIQWDKLVAFVLLAIMGVILGLVVGSWVAFRYMVPKPVKSFQIDSVYVTQPHYDDLQVSNVPGSQVGLSYLQASSECSPQELVAGYNALNWRLR